jgi:hypothetical protein
MTGPTRWIAVVALAVAACGGDLKTSLEHLLDARRVSADLLVQFTRVVESGNRAVMADAEETSVAFVRETEQTTQRVQQDVEALKPILAGLGYSSETRLLEEFQQRFSEYRALDANILGLAVENTNLKAQRLSFGQGQQAADAFRDALDPIARSVSGPGSGRAAALAEAAIAAVREIQVKSPHPASQWVWGAFKMPGAVLRELHRLWIARSCADEYVGTLVNAWIAGGGHARAVRAGTSYVDVGTVKGYREAIKLLSDPEVAYLCESSSSDTR